MSEAMMPILVMSETELLETMLNEVDSFLTTRKEWGDVRVSIDRLWIFRRMVDELLARNLERGDRRPARWRPK